MSRIPPSTGPSSSGHRSPEQLPLPPVNQQLEQGGAKRKLSEVASSVSLPNASRGPMPWRPSPPSESRSGSPAARSIGVHAILNPPENAAPASAEVGQLSRAPSAKPPSLMSPTPQNRSVSSPIARLAKPGAQHLYPDPSTISPAVSPLSHPRRIITPVSPASRFVSATGKLAVLPGKVSVAQSPFVQEPSSGVYTVPCNVTIPPEHNQPANVITSTRTLPPHPSRHSTPTLHSRQPSVGFATNPSSQEASPTTPHSIYSQFGPSSPSVTSSTLPHPRPPSLDSLFPSADAAARPGGPNRYGDDPAHQKMSHPDVPPAQGMIPVYVDLKSGSRSQAEKRKANSDASRRFRNRKKNEMAMEQKISSQAEELRLMTDERDFYRAERDFFRDALGRAIGPNQLPHRPTSPRHFASADNAVKAEAASDDGSKNAVDDLSKGSGAPAGGPLMPPRQSADLHAVPPLAHAHMAGPPPPSHSSAYAGHWSTGSAHDIQRQRDQLDRSWHPAR